MGIRAVGVLARARPEGNLVENDAFIRRVAKSIAPRRPFPRGKLWLKCLAG